MPFSTGTYTPAIDFVTESGSPPIEISKLDQQMDDIATALSTCILRDGTGLPTASIDWNGQAITNGGAFTATRLIVTGSTVPANGVYLSAANTLAFASNTTLRLSVNSTGNWVMAAPSSGVALAITGVASANAQTWTDGTRTAVMSMATAVQIGTSSAHTLALLAGGSERMTITSAGAVAIAAPSSGPHLSLNAAAATGTAFIGGSGSTTAGCYMQFTNTSGSFYLGLESSAGGYLFSGTAAYSTSFGSSTNTDVNIASNASVRIKVAAAGNVTISAPSSGVALMVPDGSLGTPALGFSGDTDTGIYRSGTNTLVVMAGGVRCIEANNGSSGGVVIGNSVSSTVGINASTDTSSTGGSATSLPALPVGYLSITINGTARKVAYYDP